MKIRQTRAHAAFTRTTAYTLLLHTFSTAERWTWPVTAVKVPEASGVCRRVGGVKCSGPQQRVVQARVIAGPDSQTQSSQGGGQFREPFQMGDEGHRAEELAMRRCIALHETGCTCNVSPDWTYPPDKLEEAYQLCATITEDFAKTFYLGTQLMEPAKARAVWAIYVWCRRTDELVDGPHASRITPTVRPAGRVHP